MDQRALVTVKDAICLMKNLQEVRPSQTSHLSIEIACSMRRPSRRPNAIQAELEAPMRPRGTEGSNLGRSRKGGKRAPSRTRLLAVRNGGTINSKAEEAKAAN